MPARFIEGSGPENLRVVFSVHGPASVLGLGRGPDSVRETCPLCVSPRAGSSSEPSPQPPRTWSLARLLWIQHRKGQNRRP